MQEQIAAMTDKQRHQLNEMIKIYKPVDQTNLIRELKHSDRLKREVNSILRIKKDYFEADLVDPQNMIIRNKCIDECPFLYQHFTDIFNKLLSDDFNCDIIFKLIDILVEIESGKIDQHEGSFIIGTLLKKKYCDAVSSDTEPVHIPEEINGVNKQEMNWKTFKKIKGYAAAHAAP